MAHKGWTSSTDTKSSGCKRLASLTASGSPRPVYKFKNHVSALRYCRFSFDPLARGILAVGSAVAPF